MTRARRLGRGTAAVAGLLATTAVAAALQAPAAWAAPANTLRVKIDEVGSLLVATRGGSSRLINDVPLGQWIDIPLNDATGATVCVAEFDGYGELRDSDTVRITADRSVYTVDLTLRTSGTPANQGILCA